MRDMLDRDIWDLWLEYHREAGTVRCSVDLDCTIDFPNEGVCRTEANGAGEQPE